MGRIKSTLIKRTSRKLLLQPDMFDETFEHNKRVLGRTMPSKKTRNKIAGYMAHLTKMRRLTAEKEARRKQRQEAKLAMLAQAPQVDDGQFYPQA